MRLVNRRFGTSHRHLQCWSMSKTWNQRRSRWQTRQNCYRPRQYLSQFAIRCYELVILNNWTLLWLSVSVNSSLLNTKLLITAIKKVFSSVTSANVTGMAKPRRQRLWVAPVPRGSTNRTADTSCASAAALLWRPLHPLTCCNAGEGRSGDRGWFPLDGKEETSRRLHLWRRVRWGWPFVGGAESPFTHAARVLSCGRGWPSTAPAVVPPGKEPPVRTG
jgi:hypothetical protein